MKNWSRRRAVAAYVILLTYNTVKSRMKSGWMQKPVAYWKTLRKGLILTRRMDQKASLCAGFRRSRHEFQQILSDFRKYISPIFDAWLPVKPYAGIPGTIVSIQK